MLNLVLNYLILIVGSVFLSLIFNKKIGKTFIVCIMSIIFILYFFGLFKILKYGVFFIEILSIVFTIYNVRTLIKEPEKFKKLIYSKELLIFTFAFFLLFLMHNGRMLTNWDEFSHWGDVVKAMYDINDFSTNPASMSFFQSYPPAVSLFQYFFVRLANSFNEYYLFIAYQIMAFSLYLPFIENVKSKKNMLVSVVIMFLLPLILYNSYYNTIYVDAILGLFFCYTSFNILFNYEKDNFFIFNITLSCFILVLLKDAGLFLVILAIIFFIIKLIVNNSSCLKKINFRKIIKIKNFNLKHLLRNKEFLILLLMIMSVILAKVTWNYSISSNNSPVSFDTNFKLNDIIGLLTTNSGGYRVSVIKNFIVALYSKIFIQKIVNLNFIHLVLIFVLFIYYVIKVRIVKNKINFVLLLLGLFVYTMGLLLIYCFNFSEYEALNLASFERYLSIYFIAILFVVCMIMISNNKNVFLLLIIMLFFTPFENLMVLGVDNTISKRNTYVEHVENINNKVNSQSKVYLIIQNTTGYDYWVMRYSLRPMRINDNFSWSIGSSYYDGDIWTKRIDTKTWINQLIDENYEYVYLFNVDNQFIDEFGVLFDSIENVKNNSLFRINYDKMLLELV